MKRLSIGLVVALAVLLSTTSPALAASCQGASHQLTLSDGTASPAAGTTSTVVTFTVRYTDNANCAPTSITLRIPGVGTIVMSSNQTSYAAGVVFSRALTLPPGTHTYSFAATSGSGRGEQSATLTSVSPASVIIRPPAPPPTPQPTPTPAPTPPPTSPPTAPPAASSPTAPPAAPQQPPAAQPSANPASTAPPVPASVAPSASAPASPAPSAGAPTPSVDPSVSPAAVPPASGAPSPGAASPSPTPAPIAAAAFEPPEGSVALLAAIAGGLFTLVLVGARRRRHPAPASPAMAAPVLAPGDGQSSSDDYHVTPLPAMRELIPPIDAALLGGDDERSETPPEEADIPRWLRPSVRQARFTGDRDRRPDWH
ncbi:MAG: hypothetical protein K5924_04130 [Chloroflexi bacterium]|nr:hypothetical protein [Chloroflexota bacterium]